MHSETSQRLLTLAKKFNIGTRRIIEFLHQNGFSVDPNPNAIISAEACALMEKEFQCYVNLKQQSEIARPVWQQRLKDFAKENEEDVDHSLDEIIEDMEEMKRSEQKITLEDIFPEIEPLEKLENDIDLSDDPDSEENIMRALENGDGDLYGFD